MFDDDERAVVLFLGENWGDEILAVSRIPIPDGREQGLAWPNRCSPNTVA